MLRAFAFVLVTLAVGGAAACDGATFTNHRHEPSPVDGPYGEPLGDAAAPRDASPRGAADAAGDVTTVASECPAPGKLAPTDLPLGYLAPVEVTLRFAVDGDTARFDFPGAADQSVRFLFVNAEETSGQYETTFGHEAATAVRGYLEAASTIVIAQKEVAPPGSGVGELDPYDRRLALVFVDGELLETRIVREGWSPYFTKFGCATNPVHETLLRAEAEANATERGLWADGHPTDYQATAYIWLGSTHCRPNPFQAPYCP